MGEAILSRFGSPSDPNIPVMKWKLYTELIAENTSYTVPTCKNQELTVILFGGGGGYQRVSTNEVAGGGGGGYGSPGGNGSAYSRASGRHGIGGGGGGYGKGNFGHGADYFGNANSGICIIQYYGIAYE